MIPVISADIQMILAVLSAALPSFGGFSTTVIGNIITALEQIVPIVINSLPDLVETVQNIISALKNNSSVTADQIAALENLDSQFDLAFEAAATKAGATVDPEPVDPDPDASAPMGGTATPPPADQST